MSTSSFCSDVAYGFSSVKISIPSRKWHESQQILEAAGQCFSYPDASGVENRDEKDSVWKYQGGIENMVGVLRPDCSRPVGVPLPIFQEPTQLFFRQKQLQSVLNSSDVSPRKRSHWVYVRLWKQEQRLKTKLTLKGLLCMVCDWVFSFGLVFFSTKKEKTGL